MTLVAPEKPPPEAASLSRDEHWTGPRRPLPVTFPTLSALDLFLSVVQLGSVSRASVLHGIAQPSASARIRHLERQLGLKLLERGPSGSAATPAGRWVAEWATTILDDAAHLAASLDALRAQAVGRLRIAASLTVAEQLLPGWIAAFQSRHPKASASLEVVNSAHVIEQLEHGLADLGFIESPGSPAGLCSAVIAEDELVLVVSPSHPLARRRLPLPLGALSGMALIVRERGSGTREALERAFADRGMGVPHTLLELGSNSAVKAAVLGGAGAAALSSLAVANELTEHRLIAVRLDGMTIQRQLRAVWTAGHALPELATAFLAEAKAHAPNA
ncbi:MAG: LysR substrate-binding domain-containing protein [Acidimicrobiales bacterium]